MYYRRCQITERIILYPQRKLYTLKCYLSDYDTFISEDNLTEVHFSYERCYRTPPRNVWTSSQYGVESTRWAFSKTEDWKLLLWVFLISKCILLLFMRYLYFLILSLFLFGVQHTSASWIDWRWVWEPYVEFVENTNIHIEPLSRWKDIATYPENAWKHSSHGTPPLPKNDAMMMFFSQRLGKHFFEKNILSHENKNNPDAFIQVFWKNYRCQLNNKMIDWFGNIATTEKDFFSPCGDDIDIFPDASVWANYSIKIDTSRQNVILHIHPFHWDSIRFSSVYPLKDRMLAFVDPILDITHPTIWISQIRTNDRGEEYSRPILFESNTNIHPKIEKKYHLVQYTFTSLENPAEKKKQRYAFYPYYEVTSALDPGKYTINVSYGFFHPKNEFGIVSWEYIPDEEKNMIEWKYGSYHVQTKVIDFSLPSKTQ